MHFVVKIAARETRFATYTFRNLSTTMDVAPGRTLLDALSLEMFGGTFKGRLDVDTHGDAPALRLTGSVAGLDVPSLLKGSGSPGGITGRLGGTVSIAASGTDGAALMRTARGTINAVVSDGTLPRLDLVRTVVLAFGKPTGVPAEGSGTAFDRLGGTFALSSGTLRTENLALASRDFDTAGRGSLAIDSGAVDARADVVLSPELTAQAGSDLRRYAQQDGRVRVPATVTGTLDRPRVSIDVAAAARRAIGNELKRRATSLFEGLFKRKKGGG
jgi:AsmA protein